MKKKILVFIAAGLIIFGFNSCKTDDPVNGNEPLTLQWLPEEIIINLEGEGVVSAKFVYDKQKKIQNILISYFEDDYEGEIVLNCFYNTSGQIIKMERRYHEDDIEITEYSYSGNIILKNHQSSYGSFKYKFELDNNNRLLKIYEVGGSNQLVTECFYDNAGNVIKGYECEFQYDNKKGVYSNINMPQWFLFEELFLVDLWFSNIVNNLTQVDNHMIYKNEYNSDNYPTKVMLTYSTKVAPTKRFSWEKELTESRNNKILKNTKSEKKEAQFEIKYI